MSVDGGDFSHAVTLNARAGTERKSARRHRHQIMSKHDFAGKRKKPFVSELADEGLFYCAPPRT